MGTLEADEIRSAHDAGAVDYLVNYDLGERNSSLRFVVNTVRNHLGITL